VQRQSSRLPDVSRHSANPFEELLHKFRPRRASGRLFSGCRDVTLPATGQPDGGSASPGSRLPEFLRPGSLLQCQALELMAARVASADGDRAPLGVPDSQVGSVKDRMLGKLSGRRPECAVALD